jgi:divalent metal cation (Fe/Co/Zn/Cd) transporter
MESINDELGMIAPLLGTLFIAWGQPITDPIATIAVATLIVYDAVGLFKENASYLLGRSP